MIMEVVVNCNVPTCNRKHNIIFIDNKAIISVKDFFKIVYHWEKNVEKICGSACQNEFFCRSHRLLNMTNLFKKKCCRKNHDGPYRGNNRNSNNQRLHTRLLHEQCSICHEKSQVGF